MREKNICCEEFDACSVVKKLMVINKLMVVKIDVDRLGHRLSGNEVGVGIGVPTAAVARNPPGFSSIDSHYLNNSRVMPLSNRAGATATAFKVLMISRLAMVC